ncbi:uncharacterized protein LOC141684906 [Apium graveolens]|uniref:uncharacterized protein LOC141684906 n=1 Tax=Apium graveolens TaxID=4045 RepID=UPI003D7BAB1B
MGTLKLDVAFPFTKNISFSPLPWSYRGVGDLKFDGASDPVEYLSRFNKKMEVYQVRDLTKCRLLAATLKENAHQWFKRLSANSIRSWDQMCQVFVTQFQASVAYAPPTNTLANIKQHEDESLREYFRRFNAEVSKVRKASDETYKNFLIAGVRPGTEFWKELQREEPKTLSDFYNKAESHKVVEESLANLKRNSFGGNGTWNKNKRAGSISPRDRGFGKRPTFGGGSNKEVPRDNKTTPITVNTTSNRKGLGYVYPQQRQRARYTEYTPLKAPISHIFEIGDKASIFKKLYRSGPPSKRDEGKYCAFHDANGHDTTDCHHLKDHIEDLIRNGYLTEFVAQEARKYKDDKAKKEAEKEPEHTTRERSINTIIGGPYNGGSSRNSMKRPPRNFGGEADDITFTEADARHVHHPHNNALVVTIFIGGLNVHKVLVDNGSSYNILSYATYQKMGLLDKEMSPAYNELFDFTGGLMCVIGRVKLPVTLGDEPLSATQVEEFMLVNEEISYNAILGESRACYVQALRTTEQTYKHVLLEDGGPSLDSCYKQVEPPTGDTRKVGKKSGRSSCDAIMIIQHSGEAPYADVVRFLGVDTHGEVLMLEAPPTEISGDGDLLMGVVEEVNDSDFECLNDMPKPLNMKDKEVPMEIDLDPRMPEVKETT